MTKMHAPGGIDKWTRLLDHERMTHEQRLIAIRAQLCDAKLDLVVGLHDGAHFIEKPDPVKVLTKFELIINLKTAKALRVTIPTMLLATADEVVQ